MIGTTNFDNGSFEHNDEVNVAFRDASVTAGVEADFEADLARSREITLDGWRRRPLREQLVGTGAWILERQQYKDLNVLSYLLPASSVDVNPFVPAWLHFALSLVCVCVTDLYCV